MNTTRNAPDCDFTLFDCRNDAELRADARLCPHCVQSSYEGVLLCTNSRHLLAQVRISTALQSVEIGYFVRMTGFDEVQADYNGAHHFD